MATETATERKWETLISIPSGPFVVVKDMNHKILMFMHETHGLNRYNFEENKWENYQNIKPLPTGFCRSYNASAFDGKTRTIYILSASGDLAQLILDNNQNDWNITSDLDPAGGSARGIMINNEFHVIGGWANNKHLKFNQKSKQFDTIHVFDEFLDSFAYHRLILIKNKLLMFGGYDYNDDKSLDTIYECNIKENNKWNKLPIKMPKSLHDFGCTTAINNKYILIFGGYDEHGAYYDDIFIFSCSTQKFTKSNMKCPERGDFEAITINNKIGDEMAVFGYVRRQWQLSQIDDHYFPPKYLLSLIHSYYLSECVHLININNKKHWKMSTLDIID